MTLNQLFDQVTNLLLKVDGNTPIMDSAHFNINHVKLIKNDEPYIILASHEYYAAQEANQ